MRAVVEYNRKRDSFRVIDKDKGEIPIDFATEAEAWDYIVECEEVERGLNEFASNIEERLYEWR